jgi:hypothetical protein
MNVKDSESDRSVDRIIESYANRLNRGSNGGQSNSSNQSEGSAAKGPAIARQGCRCRRTKCLRLYCRCFKNLEYCKRFCKCQTCHNTLQHKKIRRMIINKTKANSQNAFKSKYKKLESDDDVVINCDGCNCRTGCNRNYCGCKQKQIPCSTICKCEGCTNTIIEIDRPKVKKMKKIFGRKKSKIVFEDMIPTPLEIQKTTSRPFPTIHEVHDDFKQLISRTEYGECVHLTISDQGKNRPCNQFIG